MENRMTWWEKNKWLLIIGVITATTVNGMVFCSLFQIPLTNTLKGIIAVVAATGFLLLIIASGGIGLDHTDLIED